ncbi:hypothetical protein M876_12570 [Elizabethkingia anophelis FMS-007]|nr:hypothetical protein M876_12570 [Elizabethkingia anophelis FMS-007]CAH1145007.1 hypothetical protein EAVVTKC53_01802 [Elizabethkingia anophelis]CAI9679245.1 hypothetical protein EAVVTKC53_00933 [Elizabethkingia anophelis]
MRKDFKKIIEESGVLKELKTQEDVSRLLKDLHSDLLGVDAFRRIGISFGLCQE